MAAEKTIIIRPLVTEKSEVLSNDLNQYTFVVDKRANKIEIRKTIEEMYNVTVEAVNTVVMPKKVKSRFTRSGVSRGSRSSYKKAYITLSPGEEIDFYGDI